MNTMVQQAVADAVDLVNTHAGRTCIRLRFEGDLDAVDFVANAAKLQEGRFEFQAGIETYQGMVSELSEINAHLIQ